MKLSARIAPASLKPIKAVQAASDMSIETNGTPARKLERSRSLWLIMNSASNTLRMKAIV